jgi:hypothetical protein
MTISKSRSKNMKDIFSRPKNRNAASTEYISRAYKGSTRIDAGNSVPKLTKICHLRRAKNAMLCQFLPPVLVRNLCDNRSTGRSPEKERS